MHTIWSLLYIQFLQLPLIATFKKRSTGKKILLVIGAILLIIVVGPGTLFSILSPALILSTTGHAAHIPAMSVTMASITLFFLAATRAKLLFSEKDWSLLASLPIPTWKIVCSKFLFLYLLLFGLNVFIMLPQLLLFQSTISVPNASLLLFMLLIMLTVPLIPLILGTLLTLALTQLTKRFSKVDIRQLYAFIFSLFVIALCFFQWHAITPNSHNSTEITEAFTLAALSVFMKIYLPSCLLLPQFIASFYLGASLFIILSIAFFSGFIYSISKNYAGIHASFIQKNIIIKKAAPIQRRTPLEALLRKELASLGQFPTLLMNLGFSYLLILIFCGSLLFGDLPTIMQVSYIDINHDSYIFYAYIMGFFISTLALYAASTLSLEGKNIWIIQTLPLSFHTIVRTKLMTSLILQIIAIVPFAFVLCVKGLLPLSQALSVIFWLLSYACFTSVNNIFLNFLLPKYTWRSEVEVVKQSAASFCGTIGNMALLSFLFFISITPDFATSRNRLFFLQIAFFIFIAVILFIWLSRQKLFIKPKTQRLAR